MSAADEFDDLPEARRVGLIGHPLGHSLSPAMQDAAFTAVGIPTHYELLDVEPRQLRGVPPMLRAGGWVGCNITVPYKTVMAFMLDELRGDAVALGAVNTVVVEHGRLIGYNTDAAGFAEDLSAYLDYRNDVGAAVVLGAGGAARAVAWVLARAGWDVTVLARDVSRALALCESLKLAGALRGGSLDRARIIERLQPQLLVNCTPVGMWPHADGDPLPGGVHLGSDLLVYDLVYRPIETRLLRRAAAVGARTANGLGMLVAQGAVAFTLWTGREGPRDVMRRAAERALARVEDTER